MSPAAPRCHNPWLDLLRATAIVLVLMRHGAREIGVEGAPVGFRNLMLNGWVGVDLFFVLSGFLIARQLLREIGASGTLDLPRFLLRRGLRIVPAYAAVLALVVLGAFPLYAVNPDNLGLRTVYHLVFLQDYLPADINVVYWSLGVEEKFYLAAPLIVFAIAGAAGARYRAWLLLGGLFLLAPALRAVTFAGLPLPLDYETFSGACAAPSTPAWTRWCSASPSPWPRRICRARPASAGCSSGSGRRSCSSGCSAMRPSPRSAASMPSCSRR
jgi:peptidoglycan/LPS O-acetylase OafA/YrhL